MMYVHNTGQGTMVTASQLLGADITWQLIYTLTQQLLSSNVTLLLHWVQQTGIVYASQMLHWMPKNWLCVHITICSLNIDKFELKTKPSIENPYLSLMSRSNLGQQIYHKYVFKSGIYNILPTMHFTRCMIIRLWFSHQTNTIAKYPLEQCIRWKSSLCLYHNHICRKSNAFVYFSILFTHTHTPPPIM